MIYNQNLHTHTRYCDGANTIEEIILKAIELEFGSIGFSGHCYMYFKPKSCAMNQENTLKYKKEVFELKKKYQGIIEVYCGLEFERYADVDVLDYDYVIGSAHYLLEQGEYLGVDSSLEQTKNIIEKYFHGDGLRFARAYYETLAELPKCVKMNIVGHFDLITKFFEKEELFDTDSAKYQGYALDALHSVAKACQVFEVNTGAISRGYRTTPYPAPFIMKELKRLGCNVILTSDCHNKNYLNCEFSDSLKYIKNCGFDEILLFKQGKFVGQKI